jgi:hypothetical protein
MNPAAVLTRMQEILSDESHWTKGEYARRADGAPCSSWSPRATRFCLLGARSKAIGITPGNIVLTATQQQTGEAITTLLEDVIGCGVALFNDAPETTFAHVQDVLRLALEKAQKEQSHE